MFSERRPWGGPGGCRPEVAAEGTGPRPTRTETGLAVDRPLGSFGARIALAQRLGLLDASVEQAQEASRKVRIAFAHSTAVASLNQPSHQLLTDRAPSKPERIPSGLR
jgi:hypothetical protein